MMRWIKTPMPEKIEMVNGLLDIRVLTGYDNRFQYSDHNVFWEFAERDKKLMTSHERYIFVKKYLKWLPRIVKKAFINYIEAFHRYESAYKIAAVYADIMTKINEFYFYYYVVRQCPLSEDVPIFAYVVRQCPLSEDVPIFVDATPRDVFYLHGTPEENEKKLAKINAQADEIKKYFSQIDWDEERNCKKMRDQQHCIICYKLSANKAASVYQTYRELTQDTVIPKSNESTVYPPSRQWLVDRQKIIAQSDILVNLFAELEKLNKIILETEDTI